MAHYAESGSKRQPLSLSDALLTNRGFREEVSFPYSPQLPDMNIPAGFTRLETSFTPAGLLNPDSLQMTATVDTDVRAARILRPEFKESFQKYIELLDPNREIIDLRALGLLEDSLRSHGINLKAQRNGSDQILKFYFLSANSPGRSAKNNGLFFGWSGSLRTLENWYKQIPLNSTFYPEGVRDDSQRSREYFFEQAAASLQERVSSICPFVADFGERFEKGGKNTIVRKKMTNQRGNNGHRNRSSIDIQALGMPLRETLWYKEKMINELMNEAKTNPLADWALKHLNGTSIRLADPALGDPKVKGLIVVEHDDNKRHYSHPLYLYWNQVEGKLSAVMNVDIPVDQAIAVRSRKQLFDQKWLEFINANPDFFIRAKMRWVGHLDIYSYNQFILRDPSKYSLPKKDVSQMAVGCELYLPPTLVEGASDEIVKKISFAADLFKEQVKKFIADEKREKIERKRAAKNALRQIRQKPESYRPPRPPKENRRVERQNSRLTLKGNGRHDFLIISAAAVAGTATTIYAWPIVSRWWRKNREEEGIENGNGRLVGVMLTVPENYSQRDERWKNDILGYSGSTLGSQGCLVTTMAMLAKALGNNETPQTLNQKLKENNGFANGGLLVWNVAAKLIGISYGPESENYSGRPVDDKGLIFVQTHLDEGHPLIAHVDLNVNTGKEEEHWVLVKGYSTDPETGEYFYTYVDSWDGEEYSLDSKSFARKSIRFKSVNQSLQMVRYEAAAPAEDQETSDSSGNFPESVGKWSDIAKKYTKRRNKEFLLKPKIPDTLVLSVIKEESMGNPTAYSNSGAAGLMQVMPRDGIAATIGWYDENKVLHPYFSSRPTIAELNDPDFNIAYGTGMLFARIAKYGIRDGLLRYGPDPDYLEREYGDRYYYVNKVLNYWKETAPGDYNWYMSRVENN